MSNKQFNNFKTASKNPQPLPKVSTRKDRDEKLKSESWLKDYLEKLAKFTMESEAEVHKTYIETTPHIKEHDTLLTFKDGICYLGINKPIGHYRGRPALLSQIKLNYHPSHFQEVMIETACSCVVKETASNSPSMMLHQLASLCLAKSLDNPVAFEQPCGSYKPDLIVQPSASIILIDITSDNTAMKLAQMPEDYTCLSLSKYKILTNSGDTSIIYNLSRLNDSEDMQWIYDKAKKHCDHHGREMLYSKNLLDFFSSGYDKHDRSISFHCKLATEALLEYYDTPQEETTLEDINKLIEEQMSDIKFEDKPQNSFFILPSSSQLPASKKKKEPKEPVTEVLDGAHFSLKNSRSERRELYHEIESVFVHPDTYKSLSCYSSEKQLRDAICKERFLYYAKAFGNLTDSYLHCMRTRYDQHTGIRFEKDGIPILKNRTTTHPVDPLPQHVDKIFNLKDLILKQPSDIDPDHLDFLKSRGDSQTTAVLMSLRDYHELRFRARISTAISMVKNAGKMFRVSHYNNPNVYAEVYISGLIFEKDKGVVYVSYFDNMCLYRTDKWRLPDIENYSVAHHRLCALVYSLSRRCKLMQTLMEAGKTYGRLLAENSWGVSKSLKAYRYLSSGICMKSSFCRKSCEKYVSSLDASSMSKGSTRLIIDRLLTNAKTKSIKYGSTPLILMPFSMIGWDCFLVSLCPSSTYGRNKHIYDILDELADEIDTFNSVEPMVKELYSDFENILMDQSSADNLKARYSKHYKKILELAGTSDKRFTFSPVGVLLIYDEIKLLNVKYQQAQGSVPKLSSLMTAKASQCSYTGKPQMAMLSLQTLSERYSSKSTSFLALQILSKPGLIDLTMRMFDKDQVGGNREISILTGEFRILQVVAEYFARRMAELVDVDLLHDPSKTQTVTDWFCDALMSRRMENLTADQTKWGPNSCTASFGLMNLMLSRQTTEAYIPAAICLISEFKVFEMCPWLTGSMIRSDSAFSLSGKVGRYHMGQGIFHQSSSLYHSLVIKKLNRLAAERSRPVGSLTDSSGEDLSDKVELVLRSAVTSDDLSTMSYHRYKQDVTADQQKEIEPYLDNELDYVKIYYENMRVLLLFFGIKTSEYKNISSPEYLEFNSLYLSKKGVGSTDLKFIYSLIEPGTSGNFLYDYNNMLNSYYNALGSNCSYESCVSIVEMNHLRMCRQWRIRPDVVGHPTEKAMQLGMIPSYKIKNEDTAYVYLETENTLRFETRDLFKPKEEYTKDLLSLTEKMVVTSISNSRAKSSYRSIIAYPTTDKITIMSPFFTYSSASGESYAKFIRESFKNPQHPMMIRHPSYEATYYHQIEERELSKKTLQTVTIRQSNAQATDYMSIAVSYYPKVDLLTSGFDQDQLYLHLLRHSPRYDMSKDPFSVGEMSLLEKMDSIQVKLDEITQPNFKCSRIVYRGEEEQQFYQRLVVYPPHSEGLIPVSLESVRLPPELLYTNKNKIGSSLSFVACLTLNDNLDPSLMFLPKGERIADFKPIKENISLPTIKTMGMVGLDRLFIMEQDYRRSKGMDKVFLNLMVLSPKRADDVDLSFLDDEDDGIEQYASMLAGYDESDNILIPLEAGEQVEPDFSELMMNTGIEEQPEEMPLEWISVELPKRFGILCNQTFALKALATECLLLEMEQKECLPAAQRPDKLQINQCTRESLRYTVDPQIAKNLRNAVSNSISMMRSSSVQTDEYAKEFVQDVIDLQPAVPRVELLTFMPQSISFTSEAVGRVVSHLELVSAKEEGLIQLFNGYRFD